MATPSLTHPTVPSQACVTISTHTHEETRSLASQKGRGQSQGYRVESSRLRGWDYAAAGYYFVTICTRDRECFFGNVVGDVMCLSAIGQVAQQLWAEIPSHFKHVSLDEYVVMPNHLHGILVLGAGAVGSRT